MKKLMIMAVVAASAVAANAYTAKWGSGTMKIPTAGTTADKSPAAQSSSASSKVTAYLWYLGSDNNAKTLMESVIADLATDYAGTANSIFAGTYDDALKIASATKTDKTNLGKRDLSVDVANGTHYGVVLYTHEGSDADKTMWLIANAGSITIDDAANDVANMGVYLMNGDGSRGTASMSWVAQSVPEPTSGLLLLLGIAGLALRRRRA